jgi:hypothetical protein
MRLAVATHNREIERRVRITFEELVSTGNIDPWASRGPASREGGFRSARFVFGSAEPCETRQGGGGRGRPCGAEQN